MPRLFFLFCINALPLFIAYANRSVDLYADDMALSDIGLGKDMLEIISNMLSIYSKVGV